NVVCAKKSCNKTISSSEPTIHCWLCENVIHAKCAGFTASVSDAISSRSGIHYCCENCRAVQGEMRSFMRNTKNGFKELITGFRKINDQLCALDTQFSGLQLLTDYPKRKKFAVSDPPQPAQPTLMQPLISLATPRARTEKNSSEFLRENEQLSDMSLQVMPQVLVNETPIRVTQKGIPQSEPPAPTNAAVLIPEAKKPLQVIPPSKHIFVFRLAPDTSVIDVSACIKAKTKADIKVEDITKFKYNYTRRTSSFKIRVPALMFKTICSPSFSPENIFVQNHQPSTAKLKNLKPVEVK
ncbi:hypothetical protein KR026_011662, partial [Drosophila bipectinata]